MKTIIPYIYLLLCLMVGNIYSQVSTYSLTQNTSTYSPFTGGSSLTNTLATIPDEEIFENVPIGFNFTFNGNTKTAVDVSVNGWLAFSDTTMTLTSGFPIGYPETPNVVSALGTDLVGSENLAQVITTAGSNQLTLPDTATTFAVGDVIYGVNGGISSAVGSTVTAINGVNLTITPNALTSVNNEIIRRKGDISYKTTGTAPNRVFTVQYSRFNHFSYSTPDETISFSISLYETSNAVSVQYGNVVFGTTAMTAQVGIAGTAGDYNNLMLTSPTQWNNSVPGTMPLASCPIANTVTVPNGLVFNWQP